MSLWPPAAHIEHMEPNTATEAQNRNDVRIAALMPRLVQAGEDEAQAMTVKRIDGTLTVIQAVDHAGCSIGPAIAEALNRIVASEDFDYDTRWDNGGIIMLSSEADACVGAERRTAAALVENFDVDLEDPEDIESGFREMLFEMRLFADNHRLDFDDLLDRSYREYLQETLD